MDIFKYTATEDLAYIAAITDEVELKADKTIFKEGDFPDAMYIVIGDKIRLSRDEHEVMKARHKDVFGTWALFDDEARVVTAVVIKDSRILRIYREDFIELLADNVRITQGILKTMVKRLHSLMARVGL